jgi:hypothetical protein
MNVETVLSRLHGVKRNGSRWMSLCPAHADTNPSLSISEDEAKVLVHCFAGCTIDAICHAIGLKVSELFTRPGVFHRKPDAVRMAERQIADLRSRLTPHERVLPITVVYCDADNLEQGIARALALAVEGDIVQCVLEYESWT